MQQNVIIKLRCVKHKTICPKNTDFHGSRYFYNMLNLNPNCESVSMVAVITQQKRNTCVINILGPYNTIHKDQAMTDKVWEVEVQLYSYLTWALDGGGWSTSRPGRFTPCKGPRSPLQRRLCGHQIRSKTLWILFPLEFV